MRCDNANDLFKARSLRWEVSTAMALPPAVRSGPQEKDSGRKGSAET